LPLPNTVDALKSWAGTYVVRNASEAGDPQQLADRTLILFFNSKDTKRDGHCFAFAKPGEPQNLGYRAMLYGFFCAGPDTAISLDKAQAMLADVRTTF
jgi:hypothetical protein